MEKVLENCTNNHLIPSDNKTRKLVDYIKEGEFVNIEGYLVNIKVIGKNGSYFVWDTSTNRSDSGNGACETIYVTNVVWLKEEKNNSKK